MGVITSNNSTFTLSFGGIPFLLDTAKAVRMGMSIPEQESSESLPPRKYQPEADIIEELDRLIPFKYLADFGLTPEYPGRNLGAIAYHSQGGPQPDPQININNFYYPPTASRWSVFRGLATSTAVQQMLQATNGVSTPALFVMQAVPLGASPSSYTLTTQMYMLPPRPLAEHGGQFDGLYLVTLVDERYYWQFNSVPALGGQNSTWVDFISFIAGILGVTIDFDSIPLAYTQPEVDSQFWSNFESLPLLLDAIAYNIGCTVVRYMDGSYKLQPALTAQAVVEDNRGDASQVVRTAGGDMFTSGTSLRAGNLTDARNAILPQSVTVTFPAYVTGDDPIPHFFNSRYQNPRPSAWYEESYGDVVYVDVPMLSGRLDLPRDSILQFGNGLQTSGGMRLSGGMGLQVSGSLETGFSYSGLVGGPFAQTIHTTAKALISGEAQLSSLTTSPLNISGMTSLAMQLAADYYAYQAAAGLDEVYPGTLNWVPEAIHDIIWTYSAKSRQATTRVMRTQWNQMVMEMQHATPPLSGYTSTQKGVGGHTVAQTIRDSLSNPTISTLVTSGSSSGSITTTPPPISTVLGADLLSGDLSACFTKADYFPTQNRWFGQIDNEIILFEGTSGGIGNCFTGLTTSGTPSPVYPSVGIVYRAVSPTLLASHTAGATVSQIGPDAAYGVNLTTYEKMQFVYPHEWTSGGIAGVHVVPQMQSVYVFDDVGMVLNGTLYYSGQLLSYDATQSVFPWVAQEFIWAVERNNNAVTPNLLYDGQFVGYSPAGPPAAPIYAINSSFSSGSMVSGPCSGPQCSGPPPTQPTLTSLPGCEQSMGKSFGFPTYVNNKLSTLPCCATPSQKASLRTSGAYPKIIIEKMRTQFGLNFIGTPNTTYIRASGSYQQAAANPGPQWWCCIIANQPFQPPGCYYDTMEGILAHGLIAIDGPFASSSSCLTNCGPSKWWCVYNRNTGIIPTGPTCLFGTAKQLVFLGYYLFSGPYDFNSACLAACTTAPTEPKFWCVSADINSPRSCQLGTAAHLQALGFVLIAGPFDTEILCKISCGLGSPAPVNWWCVKLFGTGETQCLLDTEIDLITGNYTIVGGPYATLDQCQAACLAGPPPTGSPGPAYTGWWCLQGYDSAGSPFAFCSDDPSTVETAPGVTSVVGPFASKADCDAACVPPSFTPAPPSGIIFNSGPPILSGQQISGAFYCNPLGTNGVYSQTPGTTFHSVYSKPTGDTGQNCTVSLVSYTTYPPPNQNLLVNYRMFGSNPSCPGYTSPGPGYPGYPSYPTYQYPLNLIDSCNIGWIASIDGTYGTINYQPWWGGFTVFGSFGQTYLTTGCVQSCPISSINGMGSGFIGGFDTLKFDPCDFTTDLIGGGCPTYAGAKIALNGATAQVSYVSDVTFNSTTCVLTVTKKNLCFMHGLFLGTN